MLDEEDNVDEVPDPGVLPVAVVTKHRVELLGGMAVDVDDLDDGAGDAGEVKRVRQLKVLGVDELMSAGRDVEVDTAEGFARQGGGNLTRKVT